MNWIEINLIPDSAFARAHELQPFVMALTDGTFEVLSPVSGNNYRLLLKDEPEEPLQIYCYCASSVHCYHQAAALEYQVELLKARDYLHTHFCPLCEREYYHADKLCATDLLTCEPCTGAVRDAGEPTSLQLSFHHPEELSL